MSINIHKQQQAMDRLDLAKAAYHGKQYDQALSHIRRAIELDPQNVAARVLQAGIYLKQNRPNLAMSALRAHEKIAPQHAETPEVAMLRAEALSASGFDRIAETQLRKLAEQLPDDVRPYRMLSGLHVKLKEFNEAINTLRNVVRLSPSDQAAGRLLSELLQQRDPQEGLDLLLTSKPDTQEPNVLLRAARQCRELDRLADADELYRTILKSCPDDPGLLLEAGRLADEMGADEVAIERLEKAASIDSEYRGAAYEALAFAHAHAGRFDTAALSAWKSIRVSRQSVKAWAALAVFSRACARTKLADRALDKLNSITGSRQRQQMLAMCWQHAAAALATEEGLSEALPDYPGQSTMQKLLKQAVNTLDAVTRDYPQRADAQHHLAVCHFLLNDPTEANVHNDQALALNPRYEAALRLAEQIEERLYD